MDEVRPSSDFPNEETKYQLIVEEMKNLIPIIKDEMKSCPTPDFVFSLIETIDFYTLKRFFKLKSKTPQSNNNSLSQFKETLLGHISTLDSFISIPKKNSFALDASNNKGSHFKSPKVYNIEGDETTIDFGSAESILFLYDNPNDLNLFLEKNQNMRMSCFCLGVNLNFFEQKKNLKSKGYLNRNNLYFYFAEFEPNNKMNTGIRLNNLPRALFVDSDNVIREDRFIKNIYLFNLERDLINYQQNKPNKNEDLKKIDSNFVLLENANKKQIVRAMNTYIRETGLTDVHFYVKSKINIDRKGILKTKCYPVFYGETSKVGKELIDTLIQELNGQELFQDFQNNIIV